MPPSPRTGRLLVLAAAVCFGTTGTAQAFAPDDATPLSVGAARLAIGAVILALVAHLLDRGDTAPRTFTPTPRTRHFWLGAAGVAAYQPSFFLAVELCGVGVGTVVALGCAPVITGLLGWGVLGARPSRRWAAATVLAVLGVAALSLSATLMDDGSAGSAVNGAVNGAVNDGDPLRAVAGIGLAVVAAASYAVYTLTAKAALDRGAAPPATVAWMFGGGAVLLAPALLFGDTSWLATPSGLAVAVWLGVVPTGLAYLLFAEGLRGIRASDAATLTLAEPATAATLGVVLLDEPFTAASAAGTGLIAAGLAVLARGPDRATPEPVPPA